MGRLTVRPYLFEYICFSDPAGHVSLNSKILYIIVDLFELCKFFSIIIGFRFFFVFFFFFFFQGTDILSGKKFDRLKIQLAFLNIHLRTHTRIYFRRPIPYRAIDRTGMVKIT